jgi:phosphoglycolate phosphatase-like HAD superfamily hydrolase
MSRSTSRIRKRCCSRWSGCRPKLSAVSLYVGDHCVDAQAAAAAAVAFVAVRTGARALDSGGCAASLAVIDGAAGLLELLERTGRLD